MINRWNYDTHEYDPYEPNPDWTIVLYADDTDLDINCTNCGRDMTYGDGLTSLELHNDFGLGYPICQDCYDQESARRNDHRSVNS